MAWLWFFVALGLLVVIAGLALELRSASRRHDECHRATVDTLERLTNRAKARALNKAAEDYDSPAAVRRRQQIYRESGDSREESIPGMWLRDQAEGYWSGETLR